MTAPKINSQIMAPKVQVIAITGNNIGVLTLREALDLAKKQNLDLIEIAPAANPPVCKIMEYGKFQYERKKHQKQPRSPEQKEFRFNINIDPHDLKVKATHIQELLDKKHPIKIVIKFHGRELAKKELGIELLENLKKLLPNVEFDKPTFENDQYITKIKS